MLIIIPTADAQIGGENSKQKSIEVTINSLGEMHVTHIIDELDVPNQINLINGTKSNLTVVDKEGNDVQHGQFGDFNTLLIFPSDEEVIVEYDIKDELILKGKYLDSRFSLS